MSNHMTVFNRQTSPIVCDEAGHTLAPGKGREVGAGDTVAAAGLASGALGVVMVPEAPVAAEAPSKRSKKTTPEAPASTENEE